MTDGDNGWVGGFTYPPVQSFTSSWMELATEDGNTWYYQLVNGTWLPIPMAMASLPVADRLRQAAEHARKLVAGDSQNT